MNRHWSFVSRDSAFGVWHSFVLLALGGAATAFSVGCVTEVRPAAPEMFTTGADVRLPPRERGAGAEMLDPVLPRSLTSHNVSVSAAIAPIGPVEYDGMLLPLVHPDGGYVAVQQGVATPWEVLLAHPEAKAPSASSIAVFRIEPDEGEQRQRLVLHRRLDNVGHLGRNAVAEGFLVEFPQSDGTRWIGRADWETGEVTWLVRRDVNAFAMLSPDGRLAWSRRDLDGEQWRLMVQGHEGVYELPASEGDWLMPVWSNDGMTLFAFQLDDESGLDLVVLDARSGEGLRNPLQRHFLAGGASDLWAFNALTGIAHPAAPDRTPRMLFFHAGHGRVMLFDARSGSIRALTERSFAAAWRGPAVVLGNDQHVLLQHPESGRPAANLLRGMCVPRATSNPHHPFILIANERQQQHVLLLWALDVIEGSATGSPVVGAGR